MFLMHHYRQPMEFSYHRLEQVQQHWHIFQNFMETIRNINKTNYYVISNLKYEFYNQSAELYSKFKKMTNIVDEYLRTDFNIPSALEEMHQFISTIFEFIDKNGEKY